MSSKQTRSRKEALQSKMRRRKRVDRWLRETTIASWLRISELWRQLYRNGILVVIISMILLAFTGAWIGMTFEMMNSTTKIYSLPEALWWALVTMTTTGYGDVVPVTWPGRLAAIFLMFGGIALVAVFSAVISSVFIVMRLREGRGLKKVLWTDHIIVCGWNSIASSLLDTLQRAAEKKLRIVLVNQMNPDDAADIVEHYSSLQIQLVHGDDTQEDTLKRANIGEASTIVILSRDSQGDDRQILVALSARSLNKDAMIYAQANEAKNIYHLKRAGVDDIVHVAPYAGFLLASHALTPGIPQVYEELLNPQDKLSFVRVNIGTSWHGKKYGDFAADFRHTTGGQVIGLIQESSVLSAGDILSADSASIDEFIRRKFIEAGLTPTELEQEQVRINPPDDTLLQQRDVAVALPSSQSRRRK